MTVMIDPPVRALFPAQNLPVPHIGKELEPDLLR
jgi:hypothetical protein